MGIADEIRMLRRGRDWRGQAPVPRSAEPWAPRRKPKQFPTAWARTPAGKAARVVVLEGVLKRLTWSQTRPEIHGLDLLTDVRGPVIFVCNHASHLDTPLILGSLPTRLRRNVAVGAAADYFFDARWRAVATALTFNTFPIERHAARGGSLNLAGELLDDGWNLLIFPEGTRSKDGWMSSFRLGAARLCLQYGVPVVPVSVRGTYQAMPRGGYWPHRGRPVVAVRYGRPIYPGVDEGIRDFKVRMEEAVSRLWIEHDDGWWESLRTANGGAKAGAASGVSVDADSAGDEAEAANERQPLSGSASRWTKRTHGPEAADWRRIWESTKPLSPTTRHRRIWRR